MDGPQGIFKQVFFLLLVWLFIGALLLDPVLAQGAEKSTILTAERVDAPIVIDGVANESSWNRAKEFTTLVKDGSIGRVDLSLKALYDDEEIYLFVSWEDPTKSVTKDLWTYDEGSWKVSEDEDRLTFIWNIDGSINGFDIAGCAMLCHGDRMHTNSPEEKGDIWHWKASRTNPAGFMDDKWMDDSIIEGYTSEVLEAGHHDDSGKGTYSRNIGEDGTAPRYLEISPDDPEDAILLLQDEIGSGEAVEYLGGSLVNGTVVPGYIIHRPSGSRGDITARGIWREGRWNVEFKRKLRTDNPDDVQFDTARTYRFGVAIMDNTGGFEAFGKGHSFDLGARTLEFGGLGSKEVVQLALIRDYLVTAKAYVKRGESGLALSTISDALVIFNRIRDPMADVDPDLFIKIRNGFVDSRRSPSFENINKLTDNVDLAILTFQGKREPPAATLGLKILVLWGKFGIFAFIALAVIAVYPLIRMLKIIKRPEFRALGVFMLIIISPIFLEGLGRLGALLKIPFLQNLSFTTSEYITLFWALGMFIALYVGRIGFNEIDNTLKSLEYYSKELEAKMKELRKSQQQLLMSERLASIGQLAASMAHELRNPLGVIKNVSYYLNMNIGKSDPKIKKHINILDQELATSNKIITDLLDFSSGKLPVMKKVDLNKIIRSAVSKSDSPGKVTVNLRLGRNLSLVSGDSEQLQRVFYNIILNAFQAMPQGGELKITSREEMGNLIVEISDTGIGIQTDELSKIFEPLYTTKAKGIGLGLALTRQIVELHNGTIEAFSKGSDGTTFVITLPINGKNIKQK